MEQKKDLNKRKRMKFLVLNIIILAIASLSGCSNMDSTQGQYNLTIIGNQTSPTAFLQAVNTQLTYGWFGTLMLFAAFIIMLIAFTQRSNDMGKAISAAGFICMLLSIYLRAISLTYTWVFFAFFVCMIIGLWSLITSER